MSAPRTNDNYASTSVSTERQLCQLWREEIYALVVVPKTSINDDTTAPRYKNVTKRVAAYKRFAAIYYRAYSEYGR